MKKPIMIEDLCDYKYFSEITVSPDKTKASFVVSQGNMESNQYNHHIYVYDFEKNQLVQMTSGKERGVIWETSDTILFLADRDQSAEQAKTNFKECTNYYRLPLSGGEAKKAFSVPLNVSSFKFIDDQRAIVVALKDVDADHLKMSNEELEEEKDYEVIDELPYWFNGRGFINKKRQQVFLVNTMTSDVTLLTPKMMEVENILVSPNKQDVFVVGNQYSDVNNQYTALLKIDLTTLQTTTLLDQEVMNIHHLAMVDDTLVFTGTDYKTWGTSENLKFYKMDIHTAEYQCFFDQEISVGSSVGSDAKLYGGTSFTSENHLLYFTSTVDNCSNIFTLDLNGNLTQLTNKEGSVDCFSVKEDKLLFIGMRDMKLQEVYEVKDHQEIQLTSMNHGLDDKEVLPLEKLSFKNLDDIRIDGWVIKPRGYEEGKKYPAIFDIHGGPKGVYGETFFHEMQVWASRGYFVMFTNPRGSDGRGNEFMHLVNKYGTVDYSDLMEFCDQVQKKYPDIDTDKIAVTGGSYGGFMVNWIIGHTHRFCCAASQRSISNWVSKSLTTDIGYYHNMSQMASTPWDNFDRMWSFSPIKYANQCTTPTLFIHSNEDYRCWMAEGLQMFQALKIHNVDARMCLFKGETHELSRSGKPKHRRRRLNEMTKWFDKYCK